jgi:hypothetical protein
MCGVVEGNPLKELSNMTCFLEIRSLDPHVKVGLSYTIIEPRYRKSYMERPGDHSYVTYNNHIIIRIDPFLPPTSKDKMCIPKKQSTPRMLRRRGRS